MVLTWTVCLGYLGLITVTAWQAMRGQSMIAPDHLTLAAFGILISVCATVFGITWLHARRSESGSGSLDVQR